MGFARRSFRVADRATGQLSTGLALKLSEAQTSLRSCVMVQDAEKDRQELTLAHYLHQLPEDV